MLMALALLFQLGELQVRGVRLGIQTEHLIAVESIKFLGLAHEKGMGQDGFRRPVVFLVVQTVHRAEIRDAAFGRYARTAEKDDVV